MKLVSRIDSVFARSICLGRDRKWELLSPKARIFLKKNGVVRIYAESDEIALNLFDFLDQDPQKEIKEGTVFPGLVIKCMYFGIFLSLGPNKPEGLLHRSEWQGIKLVPGDLVEVEVAEIVSGRILLKLPEPQNGIGKEEVYGDKTGNPAGAIAD